MINLLLDEDRSGGLVVNVLAYNSDDPNSNPAFQVFSFFSKMLLGE